MTVKHHLQASAEFYDQVYSKDEQGNTAYDSRFSQPFEKRITPREEELLLKACVPLLQSKYGDSFTILSFGIGSGREAVFVEKLAFSDGANGLPIRLIAQDVSKEGLERLKETMLSRGYEQASDTTLVKENLTIEILHSAVDEPLEETAKRIGDIDFIMSLYGVFSHIIPRDYRIALYSMLKECCKGGALITVATMGSPFHSRIYNILELLRQKGQDLPDPLNEPGVIYTTHWDKTMQLEAAVVSQDWKAMSEMDGEYYVCYHLDQFIHELVEAGWKIQDYAIANFKTPPQVTALPLDRQSDAYMCRMLTEQLKALDPAKPQEAALRTAIINGSCYIACEIVPN